MLSYTGSSCNVPRAMREEGRTLASVDRALGLLDALAELPSGARVGELAQRTGINQSTVSRLLGTLMARGFVDRDDATARYRLGLRLVAYGDAVLAGLDVRTIARPQLEWLVAQTGEAAPPWGPGGAPPLPHDFWA